MAKKRSKPESIEKLSFEEALEKLEEIVHDLEGGDSGLDKSLERYEEGVKLLRQCYGLLQRAERRIELLSGVDAEGNPVVQSVDDTDLSLDEKAQARSRRRSSNASSSTPESEATSSGGVDESETPF